MFEKDQISFMQKMGITIDFSRSLTETEYQEIEEKVAIYLQIFGFDKNYNPTAEGLMCESILDRLNL